ncbi:uncharacterized protein [Clytia hemisphaerica]
MLAKALLIVQIGRALSYNVPPFGHTAAEGTQHGREKDDPLYYHTNSDIPHLPFVTGFLGTHGTYRFLNIAEQVATMIGDGKHGLWRVQHNGFIREYRKKGATGLPPGIEANSQTTLQDNGYQQAVLHSYSHHLPDEGFSGYKFPDQAVSDGSDGIEGHQNWIDLSIYHEKYGGKYNNHVPIDLPQYYCTLSQDNYPHIKNAWQYLRAQPNANKIGPLGIRAGLDIKEFTMNAVRVHLFEDAGIWVNVGVGDSNLDSKLKDLKDFRDKVQHVNYQAIDLSQVQYEIYYIERLFYNMPYLFVSLVIDNKPGEPSHFSFVRPHGVYFEELKKHRDVSTLNTNEHYDPQVPIKDYPFKGNTTMQKKIGVPVYGVHNPHRRAFNMSGGACPEKGGDFGRYPWGNPGSGWPNTYEEVTPICDAVMIDVKFWANLDQPWDTLDVFLGNAGFKDQRQVDIIMDANLYGKFEDPYLEGRTNPHMVDMTINGQTVGHEENTRKPNPVRFTLDYTRLGSYLNFNNVSALHNNLINIEQPLDDQKNQNICPVQPNNKEECRDEQLMVAILVLVGVICIINMCALFCCCAWQRSKSSSKHDGNNESRACGVDNRVGRVDLGVDNRAGGFDHGVNNRAGGFDHGVDNRAGGVHLGVDNRADGFDHGVNNRAGGFDHGVDNRAGGVELGVDNRAMST